MARSPEHHPVLVIGISGATWRMIDPLIAAGRLPFLANLKARACRAVLQSVRSPGDKHFRPQIAWASMATGCNPRRHGITKFFHTLDDLEVPAIWDYYQQYGCRIGIFGWPPDWPPRQSAGFIVPSHLARDSRTWPPELSPIKALDREQQNAERRGKASSPISSSIRTACTLLRFGVRFRTLTFLGATFLRSLMAGGAEQRSLLLRNAKLELSTDMFLHLRRRYQPDFSSFHSFLVDLVSHRYWRYLEPDRFPDTDKSAALRFRDAVPNAYERIDKAIGKLVGAVTPDTIVAVVSEHGMAAEPESAEVGDWRYVIDGVRLSRFVGLDDRIIPHPVARWIAYRPRPEAHLPTGTADRLRNVTVRETGLPLFQVYEHGADEVIVKLHIDREIPRYRMGNLETLSVTCNGNTVCFMEFMRRLGRPRSAMHDGEGILLLTGPGVKSGAELERARVTDILPTLLHAAKMPVPKAIDGKVLDVFEQSGNIGTNQKT